MPRYVKQSETIELHAPWWNPKREPTKDGHAVTTRTQRRDSDGEDVWEEETAATHFVEHCTVRARMLEVHQQHIQERLYQKFRPQKNAPLNPTRAAKTRVYTFLEMIVEMTDDHGNPMTLSESELSTLERRDANFIDAAIDALNEPAVPVLDADEDEASRHSEDDKLMDVEPDMGTVEGVARRGFRSLRQVPAAGQ